MPTASAPKPAKKKGGTPARATRHNLRTARPVRPAKDHAVDDLPQFAPPPVTKDTVPLTPASISLLQRLVEVLDPNKRSTFTEDKPSNQEAGNSAFMPSAKAKEIGQPAAFAEKRALLPIAIDELHGGLSRQLSAIERLTVKLEGVLMPPPLANSCNDKAVRPIAPMAVTGVNEATDRLDHHTNLLLDLISRLEA